MSTTTDERDLVPVLLVAYEDDADLEINNDGDAPTVENHDELVDSGGTYEEVRALSRESAEEHDLNILTPDHGLWDERFEDLERGDSWRVEDL